MFYSEELNKRRASCRSRPPGIPTSAYSHIRVTVTDIARSRTFYDSVFGWPVYAELPEDADAATRTRMAFLFGGVLYQVGDTLFGLRPVANDRFDEDRVGRTGGIAVAAPPAR